MGRLDKTFKPTLNEDKKPLKEGDEKWIQKAVNPEHKGYCTPMTKPTCTPKRKALAKTLKGLEEGIEGMEGQEMEGASYKAKLEEIVAMAQKAYEELPEGELPSWIQDKITETKVHLKDICGFLHTGEEEEEGETEGPHRKMDAEEEPEAGESPEHEAGETPAEEKAEHEPGGEEFMAEPEGGEEEKKPEELQENKRKK